MAGVGGYVYTHVNVHVDILKLPSILGPSPPFADRPWNHMLASRYIYIYYICILYIYIYPTISHHIGWYIPMFDFAEQPKKKTSPSRWRKKLVCRVELPGSSRWRRAPWIPWRSGPWRPWSWGDFFGPKRSMMGFFIHGNTGIFIYSRLFQYFRWNHRFISMDWFFREHFNRKAPEWMGKSMVSSGFSLQPIHWI